ASLAAVKTPLINRIEKYANRELVAPVTLSVRPGEHLQEVRSETPFNRGLIQLPAPSHALFELLVVAPEPKPNPLLMMLRSYPAELVGYDRQHDIAVLQLIGAGGLPAAPIGDSASLVQGEPVVALGNAQGSNA
ncbi:trypsin-like peptidase domain-containing protein, partial [Mycolicibacter minnesotensis]|uniref:trypsin-like peptidase domain-containing protein n=1 Tax=Mycolicibacter minnesotensis TaxID=1118379 RepID=UPI0021F28A1F